MRLVPTEPVDKQALIDSYLGLADVFHEMLAEQSLDTLLEGIGYTLGRLLPHESIIIYEADVPNQILFPVLATGEYIEEVMSSRVQFGEGITGWAIEHREPVLTNHAHLDPRVKVVPGTPENEPEALVSIPLISRNAIKGALNIYRAAKRPPSRKRSSISQNASPTPRRSRSTTRRSACGSSTRRRPTGSPVSTTTATSTSACARSSSARAAHTSPPWF